MSRRAITLAIAAVLAGAVLIVYFQVSGHEFVELDDGAYVYKNEMVRQGVTLDGLSWALTGFHAGNWHPLTWLSHMLDCELHGLDAGRHLLGNVLLHAANAVLLFLVLHYMTGALWPSVLVAALFALHPLRVESVAWVSERKDVLSGLFWMLTLWSYAWYAKRTTTARYLAVAIVLALGLLSKSMLVSLPFVLLLVDVWPLRRWSPGESDGTSPLRLIVEKLPLFGLSAAAAVVVVLSQSGSGATGMLGPLPAGLRLANAAVAYVAYLWDTIWPSGLACLYPHPATYPGEMLGRLVLPGVGAGALLALITAAAWHQRAKRPWLPVGWLWYVGTLVPVIGLLQVGAQARADRYTYLPTIGIYLMIAWGLAEWLERRPAARTAAVSAVVLALAALATATWHQVGTWRTSRTLFDRALQVTTDNYVIYNHLGNLFLFEQQSEQAVRHYREALRIKPDFAPAHKRLGFLFSEAGELDAARQHLEAAARITPEDVPTRFALAVVHFRQGDLSRATAEVQATLELRPGAAEAHSLLGAILENEGRLEEAADRFERALELNPDLPQAERGLGRVRGPGRRGAAPER